MIADTSSQDKPLAASAKSQRVKVLIGAAAAVVLVGVATLAVSSWRGSSQSVNASRLRIDTVAVGALVRDAAVNGRVVAAVSPTLYAPTTGTVTLKVKAGDAVKKGQVLLQLQSPDLLELLAREQSLLAQLEAEAARQYILAAKQKLAAKRDADQAEIDLISARRAVERVEPAYQAGVYPKVDYLKTQDTLRSAEVRSKHADAAAVLESEDVGLELKTKQNQLLRQRMALANTQRRVDELTLRAPLDGVVGTLAVSNGTVVLANAALLTLVDLSELEVEVEVPESYVADLGLGMRAEINVGSAQVPGTLSALSPEVVKNQVLARLRFFGPQPSGLRQSQRVTARLLIEEKTNVLLLPRGPFVESEGGHFAYVMQGNVAVRTPITLGATSLAAVEVVSGLKVGDRVVTAGTDAFANALRIAINE
jgi:HlyD family secretion protein